jgi:hypothetical protein
MRKHFGRTLYTPPPKYGERWTHVHEPEQIRPEDMPDEHNDVFKAVVSVEELSLEYHNLNLNGKLIMNHIEPTNQPTALASALVESGIINRITHSQGHTYFDPLDVLEDKLGHHNVIYSRVLASMAWMIDSMSINAARTVLFARYKESEIEGDDAFHKFCQQVGEDLRHESLYQGEESNERTLGLLLALRNQWHDAAQSAYARDDKDYNPKTLRELMQEEKPRAANVGARDNYRKMAHDEAMLGYQAGREKAIMADPVNGATKFDDAIKAKIERLYESYMQANVILSTQRAEGNKQLMPTVLEILRTAASYAEHDARFDQLPTRVQRQITEYTINTINRSKLDVANRLARQPIEFGRVSEAALDATEALNTVMREKYSEIGELEYAGMPASVDNFNREQKRRAAARIE